MIVEDPDNLIYTIDPQIQVIKTDSNDTIKLIEMPRYMIFTEMMQKLAQHESIKRLNIAGQQKVQLDIKMEKGKVAFRGKYRRVSQTL